MHPFSTLWKHLNYGFHNFHQQLIKIWHYFEDPENLILYVNIFSVK